ncbi:FG-GAP repeat domain-containing protein [Gottfriedia sp. NPDC058432]|uniref:FG-GAP repeat domain-containing protein n=1 Tax=Gottfriedia sp. NPDC058432 TaxID=3346497 RepID=UPI00364B3D75
MKILLLFILVINNSIGNVQIRDQNNDLTNVVKEFLPKNSILISPEKPPNTKPIQLYDFNHDGINEIIVTYETKAQTQPSPSQYGAILLMNDNNKWRKIWETETQGVGLYFSGLADITGDGTKEYLFGVTIGAAVGGNLDVYKWSNNKFKQIADIPNNEIDLVIEKNKVGIAVWQMFLVDSYLVDVMSWNGSKIVFDEQLFSKYYPTIDNFYKEKISKLNAWFYWYCLADSQIKANLFDEASTSIKKGKELADKQNMPDIVQKFNELDKRLALKKKIFSTANKK